jgi:anthranilate synthase component 1
LWVREGRVRWQAGAGIVHDSVPEAEWRECCAKAAIIKKVVLNAEAAD